MIDKEFRPELKSTRLEKDTFAKKPQIEELENKLSSANKLVEQL